jgi:putative phosphoribosyl transferase
MFRDRSEAGRQLSLSLDHLADQDVVVLALPRGGVPVAFEVAQALAAPLDVILVRKLGVPFQPELAMGAIGEDGVRVLNDEVIGLTQVTPAEIDRVEARERAELERRSARFRAATPRVDLTGRTVVIVDDGIATGSTARAGCRVARAHGAGRVVLAVPVAPPDAARRFTGDADELVVVDSPMGFQAVGQFYRAFPQLSDDDVVALLERARRERPGTTGAVDPPARHEDVGIRAGGVTLEGHLEVPAGAGGVVVFAHGSGSSRHSPRNRYVASVLNEAGIGTLLFDLLTAEEGLDRSMVFDVQLLARRLTQVTAWLVAEPDMATVPIGYFGASTGAAAALGAAATPSSPVAAIVSRGGRPDLAERALGAVRAPTRLIVGGADDVVLELNRMAASRLTCEHDVVVVPGATHLFEEPGTLEAAARSAQEWFSRHLTAARTERPG